MRATVVFFSWSNKALILEVPMGAIRYLHDIKPWLQYHALSWNHYMGALLALLASCEGNPQIISGSPSLTHWGRDKTDAISQTPFSSAFSWMKMLEFRLIFHWSLFLRVKLTIFQHSNSNSKKVYCHKLHQHQQHTYMQVFWDNEGYWSKMSLLVPLWDVNITNHLPNGSKQSMIQFSTTRAKV